MKTFQCHRIRFIAKFLNCNNPRYFLSFIIVTSPLMWVWMWMWMRIRVRVRVWVRIRVRVRRMGMQILIRRWMCIWMWMRVWVWVAVNWITIILIVIVYRSNITQDSTVMLIVLRIVVLVWFVVSIASIASLLTFVEQSVIIDYAWGRWFLPVKSHVHFFLFFGPSANSQCSSCRQPLRL